ncbi:MAG: hypothetical protein Q7R33_02855 [Nitrosarchaeum sp.]|nr:hypothetical protein [Nitrosarchaeum sp.]
MFIIVRKGREISLSTKIQPDVTTVTAEAERLVRKENDEFDVYELVKRGTCKPIPVTTPVEWIGKLHPHLLVKYLDLKADDGQIFSYRYVSDQVNLAHTHYKPNLKSPDIVFDICITPFLITVNGQDYRIVEKSIRTEGCLD